MRKKNFIFIDVYLITIATLNDRRQLNQSAQKR